MLYLLFVLFPHNFFLFIRLPLLYSDHSYLPCNTPFIPRTPSLPFSDSPSPSPLPPFSSHPLILCLPLLLSGQAKVKESLSYTAYKNMLKNILRVKDSVEPQDVQQFVILKDSLELGEINIFSIP